MSYWLFSLYKLDCYDCSATYIDQTKRKVITRTTEHKKNKTNVISTHCDTFRHDFNFTEPKILDVEKNIRKRKVSEMIHISLHENTLNLHTDTLDLHAPYTELIKRIKQ